MRECHVSDADLVRMGMEVEPGDEEAATAAHVSACAVCQERLQQLIDTDGQLRAEAEEDWTTHARRVRARARLQSRLAALPARRPAPSAWRVGLAAGVAACAVATAIGFLVGPTHDGRAVPAVAARGQAPRAARALPIRALTPGATVTVAVDDLCAQRHEPSPIPATVRETVLRAYGMEQIPDHEYELDYLITPDLGGAPDPRNLWPEPYHSPVWNAAVKDELEVLLPRLVCAGEVDLETAQRDIAIDWIAAYKKYFKTDRPIVQGG